MSHPNYNSHGHGRSLRPSPPSGDSHSGSLYSEQGHGRTTLPPLTIAFPTSDSPVSNNYPNYPTHQRHTPIPYEQSYFSPPPPQPQQAGYPNYPSYQQLSDTRYTGGQTYGSYNRASPSSSSVDPRRLPPLSVPSSVPPRDERWQGSQYYSTDLQMPHTSSDMRSPHAAYSPAPSYPQYQSLAATAYPQGHSSSRGHGAAVPPTNPNYPQSMSMGTNSLDRTTQSVRNPQLPYPPPRVPPLTSPVELMQPEETAIKKKRKRADARQLEVLNSVYARTAFPSTEERLKLANDLDMPPRSVQIWFQNKRQSARQAERNAANPPPNVGPAPASTSSSPSIGGYRGSPGLMSPMAGPPMPTYPSSRSPPPPPPVVRSGQTPSPPQPSGRSRDMDPRRQWPSRGY